MGDVTDVVGPVAYSTPITGRHVPEDLIHNSGESASLTILAFGVGGVSGVGNPRPDAVTDPLILDPRAEQRSKTSAERITKEADSLEYQTLVHRTKANGAISWRAWRSGKAMPSVVNLALSGGGQVMNRSKTRGWPSRKERRNHVRARSSRGHWMMIPTPTGKRHLCPLVGAGNGIHQQQTGACGT